MTTPLTPDEAVERCRKSNNVGWLSDRSMEALVREFAEAGLAVVDATDTPNEPQLVGYVSCAQGTFEPVIDRYRGPVYAPLEWPFANVDSSGHYTGGSAGGRGTVTQETSVVPPVERQVAWAPAPPEPGFYPGPQVDGQPTWGAWLDDVPKDVEPEWQVWDYKDGQWYAKAFSARGADRDKWVLVRRTPQSQPATERVPIKDALGRKLVNGATITQVTLRTDDRGASYEATDCPNVDSFTEDDHVEVLVENEETGT